MKIKKALCVFSATFLILAAVVIAVFVYPNWYSKTDLALVGKPDENYSDIMREKDKIENKINEYSNQKPNSVNEKIVLLIEAIQSVAYDDMNNNIVVTLFDETSRPGVVDEELYLLENENNDKVLEYINTFRNEISSSEMIVFAVSNDKITFYDAV